MLSLNRMEGIHAAGREHLNNVFGSMSLFELYSFATAMQQINKEKPIIAELCDWAITELFILPKERAKEESNA